MPMKIISQYEKEPIELNYVVKYDVYVETPETSVAKTYENRNDMVVVLEVPKVNYKDEDVQKLLKWAEQPVSKEGYYRDLAVNLQHMEHFERTVVFTHAEIRTNVIAETKADFVTIEVYVSQKIDKYVGVVFGEKLEETYAKAWDRVKKPPRMNIVMPLPVVINGGQKGIAKNANAEYAETRETKVFYQFYDNEIPLPLIPKSAFTTEVMKNFFELGYRYITDNNTSKVEVSESGAWVWKETNTYTTTTVIKIYRLYSAAIKVKKDGIEIASLKGYIADGSCFALDPSALFTVLGYESVATNRTIEYVIRFLGNPSDGSKDKLVMKPLVENYYLEHVKCSLLQSEIKTERGSELKWDGYTKTATFSYGTGGFEIALSASNNLVSFMKAYEGFSSKAEDPGDNTLTIGYGINIYNKSDSSYPNGKALYDEYINKTLTEKEAEQLLRDVINGTKGSNLYGERVNGFMSTNNIQLEQHQFDAFLDLSFNAGTSWVTRKNADETYYFNSLQMLLDGDTASANFKKEWIEISSATLNGKRGRSKNLVERRLDEIDMFFSKNYIRHERTRDELNKALDIYGLSHVTV